MGTTDTSAEVDRWLEGLHPDEQPARDARHLRRIAEAQQAVDAAQQELRDAVAAARTAGDSWAAIGMVLGVSRQAVYQRFAASNRQR